MFRRVGLIFSLIFLLGILIEGIEGKAAAGKTKEKMKIEIERGLFPGRIKTMGPRPEPVAENPRLPLQVPFAINSSDFTSESIPILEALGEVLRDKGRSYCFRIEGYTCNLGSDEHNKWLSQKRAEAVRGYLIDNYGLSPDQLEAVGYGEESPRYSNETDEGRRKNRRVEVVRLGAFTGAQRPSKVSLKVSFEYNRKGQIREIKDGMTLFSGDKYSVSFIPHENCYVYIHQTDSTGARYQLFPNKDYTKKTNPVEAGRLYRIPDPDIDRGWLVLDDNIGEEEIVVIASKNPLPGEAGEVVIDIKTMGVKGVSKPEVKAGVVPPAPDFVRRIRFWHK